VCCGYVFGVLRNVTFARTSLRVTSDLVSSIYCRSFDKGDLVAAFAADSLHTWSNDGELQHAWNFDLPRPKAHMSRLTFGEIMLRTVITAGVIALPLVTAAPALAGPDTVTCSFPCTIVGQTLDNYAGLPAATAGSYAAFIPNTLNGPNGYAALPANTANGYASFLPTTFESYSSFLGATLNGPNGYAALPANTANGYASLPGTTFKNLFPGVH
jgi:hypothetical protein